MTKEGGNSLYQRSHQFAERIGAVVHLVFPLRFHLPEGLLLADRLEHGIVAEAILPTWRPDDHAIDAAFENLALAVLWPAHRQGAHEMGVASRLRPLGEQLVIDPLHCERKVALHLRLARLGVRRHLDRTLRPARGMDAGPAVQCIDTQAAVVADRGQAAEVRGRTRLQLRIVDEGRANLLRLGQVEVERGDRLDAVGLQQVGNLDELAAIVAGDDDLAGELAHHRPVARSWAAKMSAQPIRASRSSLSRASSS